MVAIIEAFRTLPALGQVVRSAIPHNWREENDTRSPRQVRVLNVAR
jgi:hypothetical protein